MPTYHYTARDASGQPVEADLSAATRYDALSALRLRGLTVLDLHSEDEPHPAVLPAPSATRARRPAARIRNSEKATFMRQLAIAVNAGMPLREALESIAEDVEHAAFRRVILQVVANLREGRTFSAAAALYPSVFPALFVALLRVAEEAGSMPQTLDYLATALERGERLSRKIRSILAYPVFIAVFFLLVCGVMTLFVVPRFQAIFATGGAHLPALTRFVFGLNRFILDNLVLLLGAAGGLAAALVLLARTPAGRLRLDAFWLRLPGVGPCIQKFAVARFSRHFAIMARGGVPVASGLEIAAATCGNLAMERALLRARDSIVRGSTIAAALAAENAFPRLIVRMVGIGEASGKLPGVLDKVADTYEDQVEGSITLAMSLFEPIIICVFGMIVLVLVLAIYLPVFTAASHMQ
jgi:type IV pilus assembly protein PilC